MLWFFRIPHGDRFYDFELQAAWINAGLLQHSFTRPRCRSRRMPCSI